MEQHSNQSEFKRDISIYLGIIALTGLIVGISHWQNLLRIYLIVPIACAEAGILAYYFMHLIAKKKTVNLVLLLTFIVVLNLLFWPVWDVAYSPRSPSEFTTF